MWQTGATDIDGLLESVPRHPRLLMTPFVDRVEIAYAAADLVVARAGAVTCSELLASSRPSVLVPSPNVAEDHQTFNAMEMERAGAAVMVPEARLSTCAETMTTTKTGGKGGGGGGGGGDVKLEELVASLLADPADGRGRRRLATMSAAAATRDTPRAAEDIAEDVARVALRAAA